jgi:arsenate reductase
MKNILYHNPNCSKSRSTLELVNQKGLDVDIIEYLKEPPSEETLAFICKYLNIEPLKLIRTGEKLFSELGLSVDDQRPDNEWFAIMNKNPILIERPVLIYKNKAAIGRPPENILEII